MTVRPLHSFVMISVSEAYCTPSSTPPRFHSSVSSFRTSMLRIHWLIRKSCSVSATSVCRTKFQSVTICHTFIALFSEPVFLNFPIISCALIIIVCHAGFVIQRNPACGFAIRISAMGSDYKSDSFITPDYKSGVTRRTVLFPWWHPNSLASESGAKGIGI